VTCGNNLKNNKTESTVAARPANINEIPAQLTTIHSDPSENTGIINKYLFSHMPAHIIAATMDKPAAENLITF